MVETIANTQFRPTLWLNHQAQTLHTPEGVILVFTNSSIRDRTEV
jgi:hypothetical protein